ANRPTCPNRKVMLFFKKTVPSLAMQYFIAKLWNRSLPSLQDLGPFVARTGPMPPSSRPVMYPAAPVDAKLIIYEMKPGSLIEVLAVIHMRQDTEPEDIPRET